MKKTLIAFGLIVMALGTAQAQNLTGAGATFPYPIYSKWFSRVQLSASRRPDQLSVHRIRRRHPPGAEGHSGLWRVRHAYDRRYVGVLSRLSSSTFPPFLAPLYPSSTFPESPIFDSVEKSWQISTWARSPTGMTGASPRTTRASSFLTRRSSLFTALTVQRHQLHLHRLPEQGQQRVGQRTGQGHLA